MDVALLRRVASRGISLDTIALIQETHPLEAAILGAVGLTGRGRLTYILRTKHADYAAQMQLDGSTAHIAMLAPAPEEHHNPTPWIALIENMLVQGGKRGAQLVVAEVPIGEKVFELFRHAGFIVYARQYLYSMDKPRPVGHAPSELSIRPLEEADFGTLNALYINTVPQMVQQVMSPPEEWEGLGICLEGRLRGCLYTSAGKNGMLIQPFLHPELHDLAADVLALALSTLPSRKIYVRLMAYQAWLRHALEHDLGFSEYAQHAVMARHTVVMKEAPQFTPATALETLTTLTPIVELTWDVTLLSDQCERGSLWDIESRTT